MAPNLNNFLLAAHSTIFSGPLFFMAVALCPHSIQGFNQHAFCNITLTRFFKI